MIIYVSLVVVTFAASFAAGALWDFSRTRLERIALPQESRRISQIFEQSFAVAHAFQLLFWLCVLAISILIAFQVQQGPAEAAWQWFDRGLLLLLALIGFELLRPRLAEYRVYEPFIYWTWPALFVVAWILTPITRINDALWLTLAQVSNRRIAASSALAEPGVDELDIDAPPAETPATMMQGLIELPEVTVSEIMVPRTEMVMIKTTDSIELARRTIGECGHSRLPVYGETRDEIVGVLHAKDLLPHLSDNGSGPVDLAVVPLRKPVYTPETKPVDVLLREFQTSRIHMAIVLDEYGGVAGLVTIEDILECIVGDIADEHDPDEQPPIRKIGEGRYDVDAWVHVDEINELIPLHLPEEADFDTIGGYLFSTLGHIPAANETFADDHARYTVLDSNERRINRIRIELLSQAAPKVPDAASLSEQSP